MSFVASSSLFLKTTRVGSLQCIQHDQPILSSSIMMMMMMKKKNPSMIVRTYYQEHLRRRFNVQTQKMEYEDASNMVKRFYEDRHRNHTSTYRIYIYDIYYMLCCILLLFVMHSLTDDSLLLLLSLL